MARERGLPSNSLSAIGVVRHDLRDGCHGLHIPGRRRIPLGQLQDCHRKGAGCLTRAARAPACVVQYEDLFCRPVTPTALESRRARAFRRLTVRRSSSDSPPQTPAS